MGVLLGISCYIVCLRLLRWARLPIFHSLIRAGLMVLFVYPFISLAMHNIISILVGIPFPVLLVLALLLLGASAYARNPSQETHSHYK